MNEPSERGFNDHSDSAMWFDLVDADNLVLDHSQFPSTGFPDISSVELSGDAFSTNPSALLDSLAFSDGSLSATWPDLGTIAQDPLLLNAPRIVCYGMVSFSTRKACRYLS